VHRGAAIVLACHVCAGCAPDSASDHGFADSGSPGIKLSVNFDGDGFEGSLSFCADDAGAGTVFLPIATDPVRISYLAALTVANSKVIWTTAPGTSSFGYPLCVKNGSEISVLTSGRIGTVASYTASTGQPRWTSLSSDGPGERGNTYSVVPVYDSSTFLVSHGGGSADPSRDVPGGLLAFDELGRIAHTWAEPDSAEIYSSPAAVPRTPGYGVFIGSGGERRGGSLHGVEYTRTDGFRSYFAVPSACSTGGFVASPVVGDLSGDGALDVVGTDFCGTVHAVSQDGEPRWQAKSSTPFGTANPLLVELSGDGILDVVAAFASANPSLPVTISAPAHSEVLALDGPTGSILWRRELDDWVFASPVSADIDQDGIEDVVVQAASLNAGRLLVLNGTDGSEVMSFPFGRSSGTPIFGDFDDNGGLDLLFTDVAADRLSTKLFWLEFADVPFDPARAYSGFRGSDHKGSR